jgi:hypothetical protein
MVCQIQISLFPPLPFFLLPCLSSAVEAVELLVEKPAPANDDLVIKPNGLFSNYGFSVN